MKILHVGLLLSASLSALLFTGCATIVRGGSEQVSFQSDPSGAEVKLSTGQTGVTPCQLVLRRKGDVLVTIKKDGYKEMNTAIISSVSGTSLGIGTAANFLFLPIVNDIVDYKTGANYSHKPNPLMVKLIPMSSADNYQLVAPPAAKVESAQAPKNTGASETSTPSRTPQTNTSNAPQK